VLGCALPSDGTDTIKIENLNHAERNKIIENFARSKTSTHDIESNESKKAMDSDSYSSIIV
jgi:hypothetical protein